MTEPTPEQVARAMLAREGSGPAWGLGVEEAREGYARVRMTVRPDMLNGYGTIHGGMIFALADSAFAYACNSRNVATVAQGASITFLAPARAGEVLIAEACETMLEGRSGSYLVTVKTETGRSIATFQGQSRSIGGPALQQEN